MEHNIDKYSHKLSVKNDICYESARNMIEKSVAKLEDKRVPSNDIVKSAYKMTRKKILNMKGGDEYYNKYLKYKIKYLNFKNETSN